MILKFSIEVPKGEQLVILKKQNNKELLASTLERFKINCQKIYTSIPEVKKMVEEKAREEKH